MPLVTEEIPGLGGHLRVTYDCRTVLLDGRVVPPDVDEGTAGWWLAHPDDEIPAFYTGFDLRQRTYGHPIGFGGHRFNPGSGIVFAPDGSRVPIVRIADPDSHRPVSVDGVILHYLDANDQEVTASLTISSLRAGAHVSAITPRHYQAPDDDDDNDDDGEPPNWLRKIGGMLSYTPQQPEPPPLAIAGGRGRMGGTNSHRGHMGSSGNRSRGRMGRT